MIEIIINNVKYSFEKSITVLQACEQANKNIPRFCYDEKLSVAGNCRMCLVEIEKSPKPVASCAMPINPGMVIFTDTPLVKKAREAVLEFLLINHPLDCPICDQGGECDLQDITLNYASDRSRFFDFKRSVEDKECGPIIKTIMTRCIHCTRCIRFLTELAGVEIFGATGRGENMAISTYLQKHLNTELSGNLIDLCPVGALTSKPYAFLARNWEFNPVESVDFSDALGSNIIVHSRYNTSKTTLASKLILKDQILRILPKKNNKINETWISDKTRFFFDGLFFNRTSEIILFEKSSGIKKNLVELNLSLFKEFLFKFNLLLKNANLIGSIGSLSSVEEIYFFYQFLKSSGSSNLLINNHLYSYNVDLPLFYHFNSHLQSIENADLILLVGVNPRLEGSMLNMRIRKQFFNKEILIGYFGTLNSFTYPTLHLGTSTRHFLNLIEGKHFFCKTLRKSIKPLIILGSEIGLRIDSKILQNLNRFLSLKIFLHLKNFLGLNILHQNLSQIHLCDLGLNPTAKSTLFLSLLNKKFLKKFLKIYIWNNTDTLNMDKLDSNTINFCSLSTHNSLINNSNYNFPINTLFEKSSLLLNTEGLVQKSYKVLTPLSLNRNSEDFFKMLLKLNLKQKVLTNKWLNLEMPFLKNVNSLRPSFYLNFLSLKEFQHKIYFSCFTSVVSNFYQTDIISQNSEVMLNCTLFFKNKSNFL